MASPTGVDSNRLTKWLKGFDALREALVVAAEKILLSFHDFAGTPALPHASAKSFACVYGTIASSSVVQTNTGGCSRVTCSSFATFPEPTAG